jgi:hypothetical protein
MNLQLLSQLLSAANQLMDYLDQLDLTLLGKEAAQQIRLKQLALETAIVAVVGSPSSGSTCPAVLPEPDEQEGSCNTRN